MRRKSYLRYTAYFLCLLVPFLLCLLIFNKNALFHIDALQQQYTTLFYTSSWLRDFITTGEPLMFDAQLGLGLDVFSTFMYYGLTDPMQWLSALVPENLLIYYYTFTMVLYMYLAGLLFCRFVLYVRLVDREQEFYVPLAGLMYSASAYLFIELIKNPYYAAGPIYLALLLCAIERTLRTGKIRFLPFIVCLTVMANYYIAFQTGVLCAVYVLLRLPFQPKGKRAGAFFKLLTGALVGLVMAMFVLLPTLSALSGGTRSTSDSSGYTASLLYYPLSYYMGLAALFSAPYCYPGVWSLQGFNPLALFALLTLFTDKSSGTRLLKRAFFVLLAFLCIPLGGKLLNGGIYATNRFSYGWAFLIGCITAWALPRIKLSLKPAICYGAIAVIYALALPLVQKLETVSLPTEFSYGQIALCCVCTAALVICATLVLRRFGSRRILAWVTVAICLCYTLGYGISAVSSGRFYADLEGILSEEIGAEMEQIEDDSFYRVDTGTQFNNHSVIHGYNPTSWYWSVIPGSMVEYFRELEMPSLMWKFYLEGMGSDPYLECVAGVKYVLRRNAEDYVSPYGTEYALSLGTLYTHSSDRV